MNANHLIKLTKENFGISNITDIRKLIAYTLQKTYEDLFFHGDEIFISEDQHKKFEKLLQRYLKNEPISKITHCKSFWKYDFYVNEHVLDPRHDTETLISAVLDNVDKDEKLNILDIGTGSGCIIITLLNELKNSTGVAVDISENALNVARINAKNILVNQKIKFAKSSWANSINKKFDIIVSNPPYVKTLCISTLDENVKNFDPHLALDGGKNGVDAYINIELSSRRLLKKDGMLFLEIGYDQAEIVSTIFNNNYFFVKKVYQDISGNDRCVEVSTLSKKNSLK